MATSEEISVSIPIIDSHIHLYPASEISTLAWCTPDHALAKQTSVSEFRTAVSGSDSDEPSPPIRGFVLIEADRKNEPDGTDWTYPLEEVSFARRIIEGQPRPGEGHIAADAALCLAFIPWAPVHLGREKLAEYLEEAEEAAGPQTWARVKGVRYLLQDKPAGTGVTDDFIDGLKLLGEKGLVFDVGVDQHRKGKSQLEECVDMIDRAHDGVDESKKVVFVLSELPIPELVGSSARSSLTQSLRSSLQTRSHHHQHDD
jgi:L-rhamnono-1,4-lactonase